MQNPTAAIDSYMALSQFAGDTVFGLPADLVAHEGKASVLEELHRSPELHAEAVALEAGLHSGRWKLSKAEYGFRLEEVGNWLGKSELPEDADAVAQAEAAGWMWENRQALTGEKESKADLPRLLALLGGLYRDAMAVASGAPELATLARVGDPQALASLGLDRLGRAVTAIVDVQLALQVNVNPTLALERLLIALKRQERQERQEVRA